MKFFLTAIFILVCLADKASSSSIFMQHYPQDVTGTQTYNFGLNSVLQSPFSLNQPFMPYSNANSSPSGPIPSPEAFTSGAAPFNSVCDRWKLERSLPRKSIPVEVVALALLRAVEPSACSDPSYSTCKLIQTVKHAAGGNFDPRRGYPSVLSEKEPLSNLPIEKRVTATIVLDPSSRKIGSLSALFEQYLVDSDRSETTPRIHNSIRVNNRKEELSISAGSGYDQMYAFSHSNDATNSIWIILYLGPTRSIEFGRKVLQGFKDYLGKAQNFQIADYSIISSQEEFDKEKKAEQSTDDTISKHSFGTASFALDLLCPQ